MRTLAKLLFALLFAGGVTFATSGCDDDDGPAERTGEKMDRAADDVDDAARDAGDKIDDAADDAKDDIKDATRD